MPNCEVKPDLQENLEMDLAFETVERIQRSEIQAGKRQQQQRRSSKSKEARRTKEINETQKSQSCAPALRRAAMDYLARREHSFFELKQKLYSRFPDTDPDAIQEELEKLRLEKLQSDERFVEAFVRYRRSKGFGYVHIKQDLQTRRVAESIVSKYLSDDDSEWMEVLRTVVARKLIQVKGEKTLQRSSNEHSKIIHFLQNRGFRLFEINQVLADFLQ